jgi:hypothetical protein
MLRRRKKGVSTILGTIIFIGIMFTTIVPMALVMKQADTIYAQRIHESTIDDQDRDKEAATIYGYPVSNVSSELMLNVENTGAVPFKVVRVWVNDENFSESTMVASLESKEIGPYNVSIENGTSHVVKVTTERGNSFVSMSGSLYFDDGEWFTPFFAIIVQINNEGANKYRIYLDYKNGTKVLVYPPPEVPNKVDTDLLISAIIPLETDGTYKIWVEKKMGSDWVNLPGTPVDNIILQWPNGSPIVNVVVNGVF